MSMMNTLTRSVGSSYGVGDVNVKIVVEKNGSVSTVNVMSSFNSRANAAAIQAVRRLRFRPAYLGGKPVRSYYSLPVQFR
jgi:TonB family protein